MKYTQKPEVGAVVEVTTAFPNINYFTRKEHPRDYSTFKGKVLPSNYWDAPNTFKVTTGDPSWPVAVIPLPRVTDLKVLEGKLSKKILDEVKTLVVQGSKGKSYTVTKTGNKYSCTCPGFTFRRACKHLKLIEEKK